MSQKPVDFDKLQERVNTFSRLVGAKTRHFVEKSKKISPIKLNNLSFKEARARLRESANSIKDIKKDIIVKTQTTKNLIDNTRYGRQILQLTKNKWFKRSAVGVGLYIGLSMMNKVVSGFESQNVIPEKYEKGYDLLEDSLTDFGSPVKLDKVSSKVLNKYYSSIRKGKVTTTNTIINSNQSLYMYNNAINHYNY